MFSPRKNRNIIFILILAAALRFYQLGTNPPSFNWDEAAIGYNAYSIIKTGRDEYGQFLPISFRSFDDYKPPVYFYLTIPSILAFGYDDFAVRFPSAFLGTLTVLFTYLMTKSLLKDEKVAQIATFLLAISPWHIQLSRSAYETNAALFFVVLGTYAFLVGTVSKKRKFSVFMSISALSFSLSMFTYHNARVFVPVLTIVLLLCFLKPVLASKKYLILPSAVVFICLMLLVPIMFTKSGQMRFSGTSIFSIETPKSETAKLIEADQSKNIGAQGQLFHNRRLVYVPILIENYLSHLRPQYLFSEGAQQRHRAPIIGLLYLWDLPFLVAGIYFLAKNPYPKPTKAIVFSWFLVAPIASSFTRDVPHPLRAEVYLPAFQIFTALGVVYILSFIKHKKIFAQLATFFLLMNFAFYLHQFYVHMPRMYSQQWFYGWREAVQTTEKLKNEYDRVIVSTKLEQPHMFWLYFSKYDPKTYQNEGGTVSGGFLEENNKFDKYVFKSISYFSQIKEARTLFVGTPKDFRGLNEANIIKRINYLDGEDAIYIVKSP